jgi:acyl-CoA dehydrogenase
LRSSSRKNVCPNTCLFLTLVADSNIGIPADQIFVAQLNSAPTRWSHPQVIEELKEKAKALGLWNMFLPKAHFPKISPGFSNLEYGLMAEYLGKSVIAPEVTNCAAPDTGNMEVLAKYGTPAQQEQWLTPLLEGKIRSAFLMTEPDIASSDATNISLTMRREGGRYILNGSVQSPASS